MDLPRYHCVDGVVVVLVLVLALALDLTLHLVDCGWFVLQSRKDSLHTFQTTCLPKPKLRQMYVTQLSPSCRCCCCSVGV